MKRLVHKDSFFYGFLILLVILIGYIPIILHCLHTPKGYYYPYIDTVSFAGDVNYTGLIRFARGPEWLSKIPHIAYPHQASFTRIIFILLGKLSLVTGIGPAEMLVLGKIAGGIIYATSVVLFLKLILEHQAKLAFIFFLFSQPLPFSNMGNIFFQDYFKWTWLFGEAARRISIISPHYTMGRGLTILSLVFLIRGQTLAKKGLNPLTPLFIASVLIFIAGIIYPPPVFIILFSLGVATVIYLLVLLVRRLSGSSVSLLIPPPSEESRSLPRHLGGVLGHCNAPGVFFGIGIFLLGSLLPLLILKAELAKGYPWTAWTIAELGWNDPSMHFEWEYLHLLGLLVIFVPFALIKLFDKKNINYWNYFIFFWFILPFLFFPLANFLHLGKFRFSEGAQQIPLAILAAWGFQSILQIIGRVINIRFARSLRNIFLCLFLLNFIIFTTLTARFFTLNLWDYLTNVYFRPEELKAFSYLEQKVKPGSIVLTHVNASHYLPAFVRAWTIIGDPDLFVIREVFEKEKMIIDSILAGSTSDKDAKDYFRKWKVDYVYKENPGSGRKKLYPTILDEVYHNSLFQIFKVKE